MSQELQQFYKEILEWVNSGAPIHPSFRENVGLCANLRMWLSDRGLLGSGTTVSAQEIIFRDLYGSTRYPFGKADYNRDARNGNHYKNEKRLSFLRSQVGEQK